MSTTTLRFLQQENTRLQEENKILQEENLALRGYMGALNDLAWATQQITSEENLLELLDQILYNAMSVVRAEGGSLLLLDEESDELVFVVVHGDVEDQLKGYRLSKAVGIAGWVATNRQSLIVNAPRQDHRFSGKVDEIFSFFTRSILCVPMVAHNRLIGVIQLINKHGEVEDQLKGYRLSKAVGIAGWVATNRQSLIVNAPRQDQRFSGEVDEIFSFFTRSILCVPMVAHNRLIGVIQSINKHGEENFVEADATVLSILGQVAAIALAELEVRLQAEEVDQ